MALAGAVGVVLQLQQRVDTTPTFAYLTVWMVTIGAPAHAGAMASRGVVSTAPTTATTRAVAWLCDATTSGMVISGLVYFLAIVPAGNLKVSDGIVVWGANICLHAVSPSLAVAVFVLRPRSQAPSLRVICSWLVMPLGYGIVLLAFAAHGATPPYEFLRPSEVGAIGVIGSCLGFVVVFVGVGLILRSMVRRRTRPR